MRELFGLLVGHAVADFGLQSEWMGKHKSPHESLPYVPWYYVLGAHGVIHGGAVYLVTGSVVFGVAETVLHSVIDLGKCRGYYGIHVDQGFHLVCKLLWWVL